MHSTVPSPVVLNTHPIVLNSFHKIKGAQDYKDMLDQTLTHHIKMHVYIIACNRDDISCTCKEEKEIDCLKKMIVENMYQISRTTYILKLYQTS